MVRWNYIIDKYLWECYQCFSWYSSKCSHIQCFMGKLLEANGPKYRKAITHCRIFIWPNQVVSSSSNTFKKPSHQFPTDLHRSYLFDLLLFTLSSLMGDRVIRGRAYNMIRQIEPFCSDWAEQEDIHDSWPESMQWCAIVDVDSDSDSEVESKIPCGFGFSWIRIRGAWILIQIRDARISTSLVPWNYNHIYRAHS